MRLIDVHRLELVDFSQNSIPDYAILSHRWTADEASFADFDVAKHTDNDGYVKIKQFCEQAKIDGHHYVWADTCCIDKTSSAELSEAINSMYRWYQNATVCYAYLNDVPFDTAFSSKFPYFEKSLWFTRGWTLQELLAPARVNFFSKEWKPLGSKGDLQKYITNATGIDSEILTGSRKVRSASIARRMSWASERQTTRVEDIAYSLMGIFDVNMPMLYGEGEKAFHRLQEEIMKISDDQSIFAWTGNDQQNWYSSLLANHPRAFKDSGGFEQTNLRGHSHLSTSRGIQLKVYLSPNATGSMSNRFMARPYYDAVLLCAEGNEPNKFAAIRLVQVGEGRDFVRLGWAGLETSRLVGQLEEVTILRKPVGLTTWRISSRYFQLCFNTLPLDVSVHVYTRYMGEVPLLLNLQGRDPTAYKPKKMDFQQKFMWQSMWLESKHDKYKYWLPFMPSEEAVRVRFSREKSGVFAEAKLGINANGQMSFAACSVPGDPLPDDWEMETSEVRIKLKQDVYSLKMDAPDLKEVEPGVVCKVDLTMDVSLAKNSKSRSKFTPAIKRVNSDFIPKALHRLRKTLTL